MDDIKSFITKLQDEQSKLSPLEIARTCRDLLLKAITSIFAKKEVEVPPKASLLELVDSPTVKDYVNHDICF